MTNQIDLLLEAERRGILPPEKSALLAEARRRGLVKDGGQRDTQEHARAIALARADMPVFSRVADFATGASSLMRGAANLASRPFTDEGERGLGDRIWPAAPGSEASGLRTAGEFADPVAWAAFGGAAKALPYMKVTGGGIKRAAAAIPRNVAPGAVAGGTIGGLSDRGDAASGATAGGVATSLLPPALQSAGRAIGWAGKHISGRSVGPQIARAAAGADLPTIRALAANAPKDVTATQAVAAAESDAVSALGAVVRGRDQTSYFSRKAAAQQKARLQSLKDVTPDKKAWIARRQKATDPLYAAARNAGDVVNTKPVITMIDDLLSRQGGNQPLAAALGGLRRSLVDEGGVPIRNAERVASSMDGLKTAMDKQANPQNAHILGVLYTIKKALAKAIPGYERADAVFARMSRPVNQATLLEAAAAKLEGTGGLEGKRAFLSVLNQGEEALLKKSTGQARFESISDVLGKRQMETVNRVASELERDLSIRAGEQAGRGGVEDILKGALGKWGLPNWISAPIAFTNRVLLILEGRVSKATKADLLEALKTGRGLDELLTRVPPAEKNAIILGMRRVAKSPEFMAPVGGAINVDNQN